MTLIDLDAPERHRPGEAPVLRMSRTHLHRHRRSMLVVAVVLGVLAVLASSTPAVVWPQERMRFIGPAISPAKYALTEDSLITISDDPTAVSAYALDSGEVAWSLGVARAADVRAVAGVVVISAGEVIALDERTGQRLWSRTGQLARGADRYRLVVLDEDASLAAYDPRTGSEVWRRPLASHLTAPVADDPQRLIVQFAADGPVSNISTVDLRTGALTPIGGVPAFSDVAFGLGDPVAVISDHFDAQTNRQVVQGGPAAQPDRSWLHALDANLARETMWSCGGLLCSTQGNLTTALDPASGRAVWQQAAEWVNHRTMHGLLVTIRRGKQARTLLLDPGTGQVRRDLDGWFPLGEYHGRQLMLWMPDSAYGDAWLGYLDGTRVRPLVSIGPALRCSPAGRWLYCEEAGNTAQAGVLPLSAVDRWLP